jgi:hypothetical protein
LGFGVFFVIDNQSTDNTATIIELFRETRPDALVFSAYDPIIPSPAEDDSMRDSPTRC